MTRPSYRHALHDHGHRRRVSQSALPLTSICRGIICEGSIALKRGAVRIEVDSTCDNENEIEPNAKEANFK